MDKMNAWDSYKAINPAMISWSITNPGTAVEDLFPLLEVEIEDNPHPNPLPLSCPGYTQKKCVRENTPVGGNTPKRNSRKEKENPMEFNLDANRITYLKDQLWTALYDHQREIELMFGMRQDKPDTAEEIIRRIKADEFTLADDEDYSSAYGRIKWIKVKKDRLGYDKAAEALGDARQAVEDAIMLKSTDEAYKALEDFKKWEYQG